MLLTIKVNFPIDVRLFKGTLKQWQPYIEGATSLLKMLAIMIVWRRKNVAWNCWQWLEIPLIFVEVGHVSFYYESFSL